MGSLGTLLSDYSEVGIDLGIHKETILGVYYTFLILGGDVGIPLSILTMFIAKTLTKRHPTLVNMLVMFVLYANANILLLYAGEVNKLDEPPAHNTCLVQASLIYGSTIGVTSSVFTLVLQLWMDIRNHRLAKSNVSCLLQLCLPWSLFFIVTLGCLLFGAQHADTVTIQWVFYCSLRSTAVIYTVSAINLLFLLLTIGFQGSVLLTLLRASRRFRLLHQSSYHLTLRSTISTVYLVIVFIVTVVIVLKPATTFAYVFTATAPLVIFFIFGTQKDNLRIWCCSALRKPAPQQVPEFTLKPKQAPVDAATNLDKGSITPSSFSLVEDQC